MSVFLNSTMYAVGQIDYSVNYSFYNTVVHSVGLHLTIIFIIN